MKIRTILPLLKCISCGADQWELRFFDSQEENGSVSCRACALAYLLQDGILDCLPNDVADHPRRIKFEKKYHSHFSGTSSAWLSHEFKKRGQAEESLFEAQDPKTYDNVIVDTPFWEMVRRKTIQSWQNYFKNAPKGFVLDIGCGTGRASNAIAETGQFAVGIDATIPMLEIARQKAAALGVSESAAYLACDIYHLPFKDDVFSGMTFFGVFHHLKNPDHAFPNTLKILKKNAVVFGVDNNQSCFRGIFDFLMKKQPLWDEDDMGDHATLSNQLFCTALKNAGFRVNLRTLCFAPPHLYRIFPKGFADILFTVSDFIFSCLPWLSKQGGLFHIRAYR